jgi:hypothetical protein
VMVGESMFYRHQVYRQQVNGAEVSPKSWRKLEQW